MDQILELRVSIKGRTIGDARCSSGAISIGRSPNSVLVIDNPAVSWEHARIEGSGDGRFFLLDLGSANGTYLRHRRVRKVELRDGDNARIGKFGLHVHIRPLRAGESLAEISESTHRLIGSDQATTALSIDEVRKQVAQGTIVGPAPATRPTEVKGITAAPEAVTQTAYAAQKPQSAHRQPLPMGREPTQPAGEGPGLRAELFDWLPEPSWVVVAWAALIGLVVGVAICRLAFG